MRPPQGDATGEILTNNQTLTVNSIHKIIAADASLPKHAAHPSFNLLADTLKYDRDDTDLREQEIAKQRQWSGLTFGFHQSL